jgi:glycosyltransferase involved in cell wall biosynthesis
MKVLLLTTHLNVGGIARYTAVLARHLKKGGVDVVVASAGGDLEEDLSRDGIPHYKLNIRTKSEFGPKVIMAIPRLVKILRAEKIEVIHSQTRVTHVLASAAGRISRVPYVSTCHGFFNHNNIARKMFPFWGDITIAISTSVREHLIRDFKVRPEKAVLVHNGIELDKFLTPDKIKKESLLRSLGVMPGEVVVGSVGRFVALKGFVFLIEAFSEAVKQVKDIRLLLVGTGPEKDALMERAAALGANDRIIFDDGKKVGLEVYLSAIDVFALPSLVEGFGLSLAEAMATGSACIASDIGGPAEVVGSDANGILVPPSDVRGLAAAITYYVSDEAARKSAAENGKRRVVRNFSVQDMVRKTIDVYGEAARAGKAGRR